MRKIILSVLSVLFSHLVFSQSNIAVSDSPVSTPMSTAIAVATYQDKTLVTGTTGTTVTVAVFNSDGTSAINWGSNGQVGYTFPVGASAPNVTSMALDTVSKKIFVAGYWGSSSFIVSFNLLTGSINTSFTFAGNPNAAGAITFNFGVSTRVNVIGVQSTGKIIVAGDSANYYMVAGFSSTGIRDNTFHGGKVRILPTTATTGTITSLDIDKNNNIVLTGYGTGYGIAIIKLGSTGIGDPAFGTQGIKSPASTQYDRSYSIKFQPDGKILMGTSGSSGNKVSRLLSDGNADVTFNASATPPGQYVYTSPVGTLYPTGMVLDQYGRVVVTGYYPKGGSNYAGAFRLLANGTLDPLPFGMNVVNKASQDVAGAAIASAISSDERLIMLSSAGFIKVRMKYEHNFVFNPIPTSYLGDDPFNLDAYAVAGYPLTYFINKPAVAKITGISLAVKDTGTAIVTAFIPGDKDYYSLISSQSLKVLPTPPFYIVGKKIISGGTEENYTIIPFDSAYRYTWSFVDTTSRAYFINSSSKKVTIYFTKNSPGVKLQCVVKDAFSGALILTVIKNITRDTTSSEASMPGEVTCAQQIGNCAGNYMDYFRFSTILNENSGCSLGGYSDYTASNLRATLFMGEVYSALIKIGAAANMNRYIGMWMDYDNDGDFTGNDEFLGISFNNDTIVHLNNIVLKNNESYAGTRRLRVRCRTNAPFSASESCPQTGTESGETED
jgi:uncharacterized delta-60 repeat protein